MNKNIPPGGNYKIEVVHPPYVRTLFRLAIWFIGIALALLVCLLASVLCVVFVGGVSIIELINQIAPPLN